MSFLKVHAMTVSLFKALSDETRLRLVRILLKHRLSVNELVTVLGMGQSRISRHLRILTEAGLLTSERDGLWVFYQAAMDGEQQPFLSAVAPFVEHIPEAQADEEHTQALLEEKRSRAAVFFNDIADDWDNLNKDILGDFDLTKQVCAAMPDNCGTAVDLGCGTGTVLRQMLPKSRSVIGVDISSGMLEACRRNMSGLAKDGRTVSLRIGELEHLPLRDQEADFACVNLVLHHLQDPKQALPEIRRILSPKGRLFIADFNKHNDEYMREKYGDLWLGIDRVQLAMWLREAGFTHTVIHEQKVARGLSLLLVSTHVTSPFGSTTA